MNRSLMRRSRICSEDSVALLVRALCWTLVGAGFAWFHLFLLRRALAKVAGYSPSAAGRRIATSLFLRLFLLSPFLFVVARQGFVASGGLILGSLLGRWLLFVRAWTVP